MATLRSLHIGINDYPGVGNDLQGCVNDAHDFAKELHDHWDFREQVLLIDKEAKRKRILDELCRLRDVTLKDDLTFISNSSHGTWTPDMNGDEPDGRDEAICPYDIGIDGSLVLDDEISEILGGRHRGARFVFVSDSCHSGTLSRASTIMPCKNDPHAPRHRTRFLAPEFHLEPSLHDKARVLQHQPSKKSGIHAAAILFSGCRDWEYSYDAWFNGRPNGALTFVALHGLKALRDAKAPNYREWYAHIRMFLPNVSYPQTPQFHCATYQSMWGLLRP